MKKKKDFVLRTVAIASVTLWLTGGCLPNSAPSSANATELVALVGRPCTVQIKRSTLGAAANLPISPTTDSINGAEVSVAGKVKKASENWLVLETPRGEMWIARSEILLILVHGE